jgi:long-chain acyl-CoA synthetase
MSTEDADRVRYDARPWLAAYPPDVPADYDFPAVPLTALLDDAAGSFPEATAICGAGNRLSYAELREQVDRLAGGLSERGVRPGDRVALLLPNCPQHVIAFFAALRIGATVVQCNPLATQSELAEQLGDCEPTAIVCLDRLVDVVADLRERLGVRTLIATSLADYLPWADRQRLRLPTPAARATRRRLVAPAPRGSDVLSLRDVIRRSAPATQHPVDPARDVAVLQYTGGTTGTSKGAMLSHANLVANAYQMRLWLPEATTGRETTLAVLPLFHVYGLTLCLLTTVLLAGRLVLVPRFELDVVFDAIEHDRPTLFPAVPPIYQAIVDGLPLRRADLTSIRACVSGAMRLPSETQQRFEQASGARLVEGYGLTEAAPATHCNPVTGTRKEGSVGVPLTGTLARIADPDEPSRTLPVGEEGELLVKGPQVFLGYRGHAAGEQALTDDGWLRTGDLAVMDDDGFFRIVDRKKELIIAGGFNVYPAEVEAVISGLDGVRECCVVGVPDRYRGETVKAFVVPAAGATLTEDEVRTHCGRVLSAYKVPKLVEFRDDLPRTAVGKAMRRALVAEELAKATP